VRHVDHRAAELGVQRGQFLAHGNAQFRIEVGQRFVEQEGLGIAHDGAANRDRWRWPPDSAFGRRFR
jgi:hypothetical protein